MTDPYLALIQVGMAIRLLKVDFHFIFIDDYGWCVCFFWLSVLCAWDSMAKCSRFMIEVSVEGWQNLGQIPQSLCSRRLDKLRSKKF